MDSHLPRETIRQLREQLGRWDAMAAAEEPAVFSSAIAALDRLLPGGGLQYGMLVEWLAGKWSSGAEQQWREEKSYSTTPQLHSTSSAVTLSLLAAREACRQGGVLVVIDRERNFYPPAAAAWGIDLARLIVVHPRTMRDALWAAVQSLRSPAVAAMWTTAGRLDSREFRRLQLAAGAGHTLGLLIRPTNIRGQPSWADVTLVVGEPLSSESAWAGGQSRIKKLQSSLIRHTRVRLARARGAHTGGHVTLEIDDATHVVREAKEGRRLSAIGYRPGLLADSR